MRHDLAIVVASAVLVLCSQTRVAAETGSLTQESAKPTSRSAVTTAAPAAPSPTFDLRLLAAGMASDPAVVAKSHDDKDKKDKKDKDKNENKDAHKKDKHKDKHKDHDKNHDGPKDWNPDNDWGRGGGSDLGTETGSTPSSPTPEPGTLLLTGLVAATAGLRARRARRPD